jgi:uncharacterized membrane protein
VLNLLLLMLVAVTPFPTALVGDELATHLHGGDAKTAVVAYGLLMIVMSICFSALWWYVVFHPEMLDGRLEREDVRRSIPRFGVGFFGYIIATLLGFVSPVAALVLLGVLAVYYAFEHLPSPRKLDTDTGTGAG